MNNSRWNWFINIYACGAVLIASVLFYSFKKTVLPKIQITNVVYFPMVYKEGLIELSGLGVENICNVKAALIPSISGLNHLPLLVIEPVSKNIIHYRLIDADSVGTGVFIIDDTYSKMNLRLTLSGY